MNRTYKERLEKQLKEAQELFEQCKKETIREIENITTRNASDFGTTYFTHIDRITLAGQKVQTLEQVLKILDDYPNCEEV